MTQAKQKASSFPQRMQINTRAQTILEYVVLIGIATMVLTAMGPSIRRGIQSVIKLAADQIAPQQESEQVFDDKERGYLVNSFTTIRSKTKTHLGDDIFGRKTFDFDDTSETITESFTNEGFTEVSQ